MITAIVGSGGKTTLLKTMAAQFRSQDKRVFVTTTTHMFIEPDTLLTDDSDMIIQALEKTGYVMAGIPEGIKIRSLSPETYKAACAHADVVLVEADGSKHMPLKFPNATEPVIPDNADEIIVVCSLNAIGQKARDVCHRLDLVTARLGIEDDTIITAAHVQQLVTEGYLIPLRKQHPGKRVHILPRQDGSAYQTQITRLLQTEEPIPEDLFLPQSNA